MSDYQALFAVLMDKSGLSSQELERKLSEKIESLGHFVNEDVALRLVARDLNISLINESSKKPSIQIVDLVPGMNNVSLELIVESVGVLKEFIKKEGTEGKLLRISVYDASGRAFLLAWDEHTKAVESLVPGSKVFIHSAYTKNGLRGDVEIHLGNRSNLELVSVPPSNNQKYVGEHKGIVWRTSDLVVFKRKDGSQGTLASFMLKEDDKMIRILIWNPVVEALSGLKEGAFVEISNGVLKADLAGRPELHLNSVDSIRISQDGLTEVKRDLVKLSGIVPNMNGIDVEATVDMVFEVSTTYNGKSYLRILVRDGETVLPVTLWNEKALEFADKFKKGSAIRLENCFSKLGPQGLELGINRWSRICLLFNR